MGIQSRQELDLEKELVDHKSHSEMQRLNLQAGFTYVAEGTKAAFLLNGAAAIALMTFMGSSQRPGALPILALTAPLASFATGALLAVVTLAIAYVSQSFFAGMNVRRKQRSFAAVGFAGLGMLTLAGSAYLFVTGIAKTGAAFDPTFSIWSTFGL